MIPNVICTSCLFWRPPAIPKSRPNPHPDAGMASKRPHNADEHNRSICSTKHHESWRKVSDFNTITCTYALTPIPKHKKKRTILIVKLSLQYTSVSHIELLAVRESLEADFIESNIIRASQQGAKHGITIKPWQATPLHGAKLVDEGTVRTIPYECKIKVSLPYNGRRRSGNTSTVHGSCANEWSEVQKERVITNDARTSCKVSNLMRQICA
jgi:hypothetical protein